MPAEFGGEGPDIRGLLRGRGVDVVTFTSGSSVRNFARALGGRQAAADLLRHVDVACIGPVTAEAASRLDIATTIMPAESTVPALIEAIVEHRGGTPRRLNIAATIMPAESTVPALIEAIVEHRGARREAPRATEEEA